MNLFVAETHGHENIILDASHLEVTVFEEGAVHIQTN